MSNPQSQKEAPSATKAIEEPVAASEVSAAEAISDAADTSHEVEAATAPGTDKDDPESSLQAQLETTAQESAKFKDVALRAEAEMQNLRRRQAIDLEKAHKFGLEKLMQNLLPVVDSLEKGVESARQSADEPGNQAIIDGVSLCQKMLMDALTKEGLAMVDPQGEPFDPNLHQAMSMVENPDMEPNSVVAVIQKGYTLHSRLLRPAMVMVSKSEPETDDSA